MPNETGENRADQDLDDDELDFVEATNVEEVSDSEIVDMDDQLGLALSQGYPPGLSADLNDLDDAALGLEDDAEASDDAELAAMADELGLGPTTEPPEHVASVSKPTEAPGLAGPVIDVADELSPSEEGQMELGHVTALKVLFGCAMASSSGILRFRNEAGTVKLHYRRGIIEAVRCSIPELGFDRHLIERGTCTDAELQAARASDVAPGGDLPAALVSAQIATARQVAGELVEWSKSVLGQLAGWNAGFCHFLEGRPPDAWADLGFERFTPLQEAVRVAFTLEQLRERFERIMARSLIPTKAGSLGFEDLGLHGPEQAAFSRLDGEKTLQDLLEGFEGDPEAQAAALRAVHLGLESDLIQIGPGPVARAQLKRAEELERELVQLRQRRNFFEILGVGPEAADAEVKRNYLDLIDHYTRDTAPKELPRLTEARKKLSDLLEKAFTALSTREKRERGATVVARINPVNTQNQSLPPRAPSLAPAAKAQSSVELFEEAEAAALKANYVLCLQKIDEAIEARPDRIQYRLYKEYYKALSDKYDRITAAGNAIKEIQKLVGDNDRVVDAHLLMGRLYKFARKKAEAGAAFERVLELEPDNPEAQTEVRIKSNRAQSSVIKPPTRAESALSFFKNLVNKEEEDPKKKKKKKPPPT